MFRLTATATTIFLLCLAAAATAQSVPEPSGGYTEGASESFQICADAACTIHTTNFALGATVYLKVTGNNDIGAATTNQLLLKRMDGTNRYSNNAFWSCSGGGGVNGQWATCTGSFATTGWSTGWYYIRTTLDDTTVHEHQAAITVGTEPVSGYHTKFFSDPGYSVQTDTFNAGSTVYVEINTASAGTADATQTSPTFIDYHRQTNSIVSETWDSTINPFRFHFTMPYFVNNIWQSFSPKIKNAAGTNLIGQSNGRQLKALSTPGTPSVPEPTDGYTWETGETLQLCADTACSTYTTNFPIGGTVHVKVTGNGDLGVAGTDRIRVFRMDGTSRLSRTGFWSCSGGGGVDGQWATCTGSFTTTGWTDGWYYVVTDLIGSGTTHRQYAPITVGLEPTAGYHISFFSDPGYTTQIDSATEGSTVYVEINTASAGTADATQTSPIFKDYHDATSYTVGEVWDSTTNPFRFHFTMPAFVNGAWQSFLPRIKDAAATNLMGQSNGRQFQAFSSPGTPSVQEPVGGYTEGASESFQICADAACSIQTTNFPIGATVHVKVTGNNNIGTSVLNRLQVRRMDGGTQYTNSAFWTCSGGGGVNGQWAQCTGSFTTTGFAPGWYYIRTNLDDAVNHRHRGAITVSTEPVSGYHIRFFSDSGYSTESDDFERGQTVYVEVNTASAGTADPAQSLPRFLDYHDTETSVTETWDSTINPFRFHFIMPGAADGWWVSFQPRIMDAVGTALMGQANGRQLFSINPPLPPSRHVPACESDADCGGGEYCGDSGGCTTCVYTPGVCRVCYARTGITPPPGCATPTPTAAPTPAPTITPQASPTAVPSPTPTLQDQAADMLEQADSLLAQLEDRGFPVPAQLKLDLQGAHDAFGKGDWGTALTQAQEVWRRLNLMQQQTQPPAPTAAIAAVPALVPTAVPTMLPRPAAAAPNWLLISAVVAAAVVIALALLAFWPPKPPLHGPDWRHAIKKLFKKKSRRH